MSETSVTNPTSDMDMAVEVHLQMPDSAVHDVPANDVPANDVPDKRTPQKEVKFVLLFMLFLTAVYVVLPGGSLTGNS